MKVKELKQMLRNMPDNAPVQMKVVVDGMFTMRQGINGMSWEAIWEDGKPSKIKPGTVEIY